MGQRKSEVAGLFFPGTKAELASTVHDLCERTTFLRETFPAAPLAVISPHAGYKYSGPLTAAAWSLTARMRPVRIMVLSPSHKVAFRGLAVPGHRAVSLPGMRVPLAVKAIEMLVGQGLAHEREDAFALEHGIDTQLPFAAQIHPEARVLPVVIGDASVEEVARAIDAVAAMSGETLFVLSSDLSHFLTEPEANKRDLRTAGLIELGQGEALTGADACGHRAIAGFLASQTGQAARAVRVGRTTSASTTGDASRVVGYGVWGLFPADRDVLSPELRGVLLGLSRKALASRLAKGRMPEIRVDSFALPLRTIAASFVTIELDGRLRGCIGSMAAHRPLVQDVMQNAVKAGFEDPRFPQLTEAELDRAVIKISVLTRPAPLRFQDEAGLLDQLVPGQTGVILQDGTRRGTFLPSVWSSLKTPAQFLGQLKRKAGLPEDHWSDTLQAWAYRAEYFGEPDPA